MELITGSALTITGVVAVSLQPLTSVTITVYVPVAAVVAAGTNGLNVVALNPAGPDHV
jgi:hypothetical protein